VFRTRRDGSFVKGIDLSSVGRLESYVEWACRAVAGGNPELRFAAAEPGDAAVFGELQLNCDSERLQCGRIECFGARKVADGEADVVEGGGGGRSVHIISFSTGRCECRG